MASKKPKRKQENGELTIVDGGIYGDRAERFNSPERIYSFDNLRA